MNTQDTTETTPPDQTDFWIRSFLRERQALLVHFSTLMSNHPGLVFPDDLRQAAGLTDVPLSFSTIMAGDVGPYQHPDMHPADANAGGSIGIIVDIPSNDSVVTVGCKRRRHLVQSVDRRDHIGRLRSHTGKLRTKHRRAQNQ